MGRIGRLREDLAQHTAIAHEELGGSKLVWRVRMIYCFIRYGAKPVDYWRFRFWRKSSAECRKFLTGMKYSKLYKKLRQLTGSMDLKGKIFMYRMYSAYIRRDWVAVTKATSEAAILDFIKKHHVIIAKPNVGEQGHGILKIRECDADKISDLMSSIENSEYVLEECIRNSEEISRLNPTSLNTVRCYTFIDKEGKDHVIGLMMRVGALGSSVDNWGSGGVGYNFDIETGVCMQPGVDKKTKEYIFHPGTEVQMVGFRLPDLEGLKQYVHDLMSVNRQARFVGWDIAITPDGYELVEMNCPGGRYLLQIFGTPWGKFIKKNW